MDHFSRLPAELQIEIFDHLETSDAKAARVVSKTFRDNATPALFRSLVACARHQALSAYQNVSQHPTYSTYVKEVVFDGRIYSQKIERNIFDYCEAESEVEDVLSPANLLVWSFRWRTTLPDASAQLRWKRYRTLYKEQEDMNANGFLLQSLVRGLKNMQNISSVVFSPNHHTIPVEKENLRGMAPTEHDQRHVNHVDIAPPNHPFRQLIYAIFLTQYTGVRQLVIREPCHDRQLTRFSLFMFTMRNAHDMHAAKYVFRHLLKLDLNIYIPRHDEKVQFPPNIHSVEKSPRKLLANLAELLKTAQDLRHLSVVLPFWLHWTEGGVYLHRQLGLGDRSQFCYLGLGATWPMLHSLNLGNIYATKQDLMDFLARHRDTLKVLKLTSCSMSEGIWSDVVDEVIFNTPMISTFVLDQVDEASDPDWGFMTHMNTAIGRYEGYMHIGANGEREFVSNFLNSPTIRKTRKSK